MTQAMYSAVSGIRANQTKLNVISNNIANVNTLGFKGSSANFATVFASTISGGSSPNGLLGGTNPRQIGNGALVSEIASNWGQGGTQFTGRNTDLMINGNGFFVVERIDVNNGNNSTDYSLTRAGNFTLDANGNLVTSSGNRVRGSSDVNGNNAADLGRIQIPLTFNVTKDLTAVTPTGGGNIVGIHLDTDATAAQRTAAMVGTAATQSNVQVSLQSYSIGTDGSITARYSNGDMLSVRTEPGTTPPKREMLYTTSDGQAFSVSGGDPKDSGKLDQIGTTPVFDGGVGLSGAAGMTAGMDGRQFQLQIASVVNPAGLMYDGNNNFLQSANSGAIEFGAGGIGSRGSIQSGALESSNVDLSGEFTDMIITQRGLEAASKMVKTQSEVMQTIIQMVS